MSSELPIADNHAHANPVRGLGARMISRKFRKSGGTLIVFVALTSRSLGLTPGSKDDLRKLYEVTVRSAAEAKEEGVLSAAVVGLHPSEVFELLKAGRSPAEVLDFGNFSVDLAARMVDEGAAVGYGEYGRPHWDADPLTIEICDRITLRVLEAARDHGGVVHIHSERAEPNTVMRMSAMAASVGLDPSRIVLHHALPAAVAPAASQGLIPSIPAGRRGELEEAVASGPHFVVESDFMDDPERPGAVTTPWGLSRRIRRLLLSGTMTPQFYVKILEIFKKLYDIDPFSGLRGTS